MADRTTSPLLLQYRDIKSRHQDAILFFRMGDFYEMFFEDAEIGAKALNITLTSRGDGVPLAGVPVKAAAGYVRQLVGQGHRVAICEQVEDPKKSKGIVKRDVVETVTPGALLEDGWLPGERNNYLVAAFPRDGRIGLAAIDLSTGEFQLEVVAPDAWHEALSRLHPAELLAPAAAHLPMDDGVLLTEREPWEFDPELAQEELARRFELSSLSGLGLAVADAPAIGAGGALLRYLGELQPGGLPHLTRPTVRRGDHHLWLDEMTRRNLELVEPLISGAKGVTLLEIIDGTVTPMGARLLRAWLLSPLKDPRAIDERLDAVAVLLTDSLGRERVRQALTGVRDLERLAGRAAAGRANPRELAALRDSFTRLPDVLESLIGLAGERDAGAAGQRGGEGAALLDDDSQCPALAAVNDQLDPLTDVCQALTAALADRPPPNLADGGVIQTGFDAELDELRDLRDGGKQYIASLQERERTRTDIPSLKVGFNKVFGYYLEITKIHDAKVPADYERRQTLANAERYVTPELKEYEAKILGAEDRIATREAELFQALRRDVGGAIDRIQQTSRALARLDVWAALAERAAVGQYVRPTMTDEFHLEFCSCRHPVIEEMMPRENFIPNDVRFDETQRLLLVTGPNMAGKSTILRQIGLCTVLAQMGSFVPASSARVGVVDRLFTRVGASDNLARGQSTFMVEMSETSAILHNATARSLVLLDEIGRGTSTYDGVAIAWAVSEHLHDRIGCKTMFATHYHELMQLPEELQHARNFNVAVRDTGDSVVFLHRLEPGGTDRSYGVHVAQLAGLPAEVVRRAKTVLATLEGDHRVAKGLPPPDPDPGQFGLFGSVANPMLDELRDLDVDSLTPLEALNRLADLTRRAKDDS